MKRRITFLALCWCAFRADGGALLIITEPTARGHAGPLFDQWVAQIQREGTFSPIVVRELHRWAGGWTTNDWTAINRISNEIARVNPAAVQLVGRHAPLMTGGHAVDGHQTRRIVTYMAYGCTNMVYTDSTAWDMEGTIGAYDSPLGTNQPGDGIPDQTFGTFGRPVCVLDASGLTYSAVAGTFATGYLAGQNVQPAVDEGDALRRYLTNNLVYRQQGWTVTETGYIRSDQWLSGSTVTATNNSVTWSSGTDSFAGRTDRWLLYGIDPPIWSPNFVTAEGVWTRVFWAQVYKSYCMEVANGASVFARHLFPGFAEAPIALVGSWGHGNSTAAFFWFARATDVTVADAIQTSAVRTGAMPFEYPIQGDLTLPIDAITQPPPATAIVGTLAIQ